MCASDVINNIAKQNMNVMASVFRALHVKRWTKTKRFDKSKYYCYQNVPYILRKCKRTLDNFAQKERAK